MPLYLSIAAAWLQVPFCLQAIRSSASAGADTFWTTRPGITDLLYAWGLFSRASSILLGALALATLATILLHRISVAAALRSAPRAPLMLTGALLLVQLVLFLKSQVGISIYAERYLLPLITAVAFAAAGMLSILLRCLPPSSPSPVLSLFASVLLLIPFAVYSATRPVYSPLYPRPNYPEKLASILPPDLPVVVTPMSLFTLQDTYDHTHVYLFLLDWPYDRRPGHAPREHSGAHLLENWKRAGYDSDRILPCHDILARYPDFTLLLDPGRQDWLRDRLLHNPAYQVRQFGTFKEWQPVTVGSVHRLKPAPPPC